MRSKLIVKSLQQALHRATPNNSAELCYAYTLSAHAHFKTCTLTRSLTYACAQGMMAVGRNEEAVGSLQQALQQAGPNNIVDLRAALEHTLKHHSHTFKTHIHTCVHVHRA